jgi:hypothetical protein
LQTVNLFAILDHIFRVRDPVLVWSTLVDYIFSNREVIFTCWHVYRTPRIHVMAAISILHSASSHIVGFEVVRGEVTVFWHITPCSPGKVSRSFLVLLPPSLGLNIRNQHGSACRLPRASSLLYLLCDPEDEGVPPICCLTFTGIHGIVYQKIQLFIFTHCFQFAIHRSLFVISFTSEVISY